MNRALRRHPVVEKPGSERSQKPVLRPGGGGGRRPQQAKESRGLRGIIQPRWAMEIISELRKVTWPTREETWYLTVVVLVVAGAIGIFLGGVDMFFNWAIDHTLLR
jgi:preprotein translocase SecE subunit